MTTMRSNDFSMRQPVTGLTLADGSNWRIIAGDERASILVSSLAVIMKLQLLRGPSTPFEANKVKPSRGDLVSWLQPVVQEVKADQLRDEGTQYVRASDEKTDFEYGHNEVCGPTSFVDWSAENEKLFTCILKPTGNYGAFASLLMQVSLVIAQHAEGRGGVLLHGALVEKDGVGVVLAGPGGVGKTPASRRLAPPWRSLCDDATLVVRDEQGSYWCHPWPTWSTFMFDGSGGSWDVQHAVSLKGIFFLEKARKVQAAPLGTGQAVCLLTESARQLLWPLSRQMNENEARKVGLQRFNNICLLAQSVGSYILRLNRDGAFWQEIDRALTGD